MFIRLARSLEVQESAVKKCLAMGIKLVHSTIPDLFVSDDPSTVLMRMVRKRKKIKTCTSACAFVRTHYCVFVHAQSARKIYFVYM